ncbi:MAG: hypothetical protein J7K08_08090 [Thermoplasmata archaeon]|nr:hypothetical protein [Thermoplasmata archaeon]
MRSEDLAGRALLQMILFILLTLPATNVIMGGNPPTGAEGTFSLRSPGADVAVTSFLSHSDGGTYPEGRQNVIISLKNTGNETFNTTVYVSLTVHTTTDPLNTTYSELAMVPAGTLLFPGNETRATFVGWNATPGWYILNVTIQYSDDNLTNNTLKITVHIVARASMLIEINIEGPREQVIPPGSSTLDPGFLPFSFSVRNRGESPINVTYTITSSHGWLIPVNPIQGTLVNITPGTSSTPIYFNVKVPEDALTSSLDRINITAVKEDNSSVRAEEYVLVFTQEIYSVEVVAPPMMEGVPGGPPLIYTFRVRNTGNIPDKYHLTLFNQSWWPASLLDGEYTSTVAPGEEVYVRAMIRIPPLIYDRRVEMRTFYGAIGLLTLRAESLSSGVQNSAIAYTRVSLIYTVEVMVRPEEAYLNPLNTSQRVLFNISVRGVDNRENPTSSPYVMINLSVKNVRFYPAWISGWNSSESKRYSAGLSVESLYLKGGEWDSSIHLQVIVPERPYHGRCTVNITATTSGDGDDFGVELPSFGVATVHINQSRSVLVFPEITDRRDTNSNGIPDGQEATPGEYLEVFFNVTNTGNGVDYFRLEVWYEAEKGEEWEVMINGTSSTPYLTPAGFHPSDTDFFSLVSVLVRPPLGLEVGSYCDIFLKAYSGANPIVENVSSLRVYVKEGLSLKIEPPELEAVLYPGERRNFNFTAVNMGNVRDGFIFEVISSGTEGWVVQLAQTYLDLLPSQSGDLTLTILCPEDAVADREYVFTLRGISVTDPRVNASSTLKITVLRVLDTQLIPLDITTKSILPGSGVSFSFLLTNTGNYNETFEVGLIGVPSNWSATSTVGGAGSVTLPPLGTAIILINVTAPGIEEASSLADLKRLNIVAGTNITISLKVTPTSTPSKFLSRNVHCIVEQLHRARAYGPSSSLYLFPGQRTEATLRISNLGNGVDGISLMFTGDDRYRRWVEGGGEAIEVQPFGEVLLTVGVTPLLVDVPRYNEVMTLDVVPVTSDGLPQTPGKLTGLVVPYYYNVTSTDVDLGRMSVVTLYIMNLPSVGSNAVYGGELPRIVNLRLGNASEYPGWTVALSASTLGFNRILEKKDVELYVTAPRELRYYSGVALVPITITSSDNLYSENIYMNFRAVYVDLFISRSDIVVKRSIGGGEATVSFRIRAEGLKPSGNFRVNIYLDGKQVESLLLGSLNPSGGVVSTEEEIKVELPEVKWYRGEEEHTITFLIDPDDSVYEANPLNFDLGEGNNHITKSFVARYPTLSYRGGGVLIVIFLLAFLSILYLIYRYGLTHIAFHMMLGAAVIALAGSIMTIPLSTYSVGSYNIAEFTVAVSLIVVLPLVIWITMGYHRYYMGWRLYRVYREEEPEKSDEEILDTLGLDHVDSSRGLLYASTLIISLLGPLVYLILVSVPGIFEVGSSYFIKNLLTPLPGGLPTISLLLLYPLFGLGLLHLILWKKETLLEEIIDVKRRMQKMKVEIDEEFEPYRGI